MNREDKLKLYKKGIFLEYFTVGYNIFEGIVSIAAGLGTGSIALVGFGLDSFVESLSGSILIWRLRNHSENSEKERYIEEKAIKLVAYTFFILALYVGFEAVKALYFREAPEGSVIGIIISILSILIMPILARNKRKVGEEINSRALIADSQETVACVMLSITLFLGLLLNYLFGWWWSDSIASLIIVGFLIKEGRELLEGEEEGGKYD